MRLDMAKLGFTSFVSATPTAMPWSFSTEGRHRSTVWIKSVRFSKPWENMNASQIEIRARACSGSSITLTCPCPGNYRKLPLAPE